jgi:transposase-like protein
MTDVAATVAASELRVEIVGERRCAYDAAFRAQVVAESFLSGVRATELAKRHGICKSLIYRWRRMDAPGAAAVAARPASAAVRAEMPETLAAAPMLEFVPNGVLERPKAEMPALANRPAPSRAGLQDGRRAAPAATGEDQPGLIRIDLACGTRQGCSTLPNDGE